MTNQANSKKDLTKKDLIKILEKIDSERIKQNLKEYSVAEQNLYEKKNHNCNSTILV